MAAYNTTDAGRATRDAIVRAAWEIRQEKGFMASPGEIAARLGIPRSTLTRHVRILEHEGRVQRTLNGHGILVLIPPPSQSIEAPTDFPAFDFPDEE